jgi:hypothetical protein
MQPRTAESVTPSNRKIVAERAQDLFEGRIANKNKEKGFGAVDLSRIGKGAAPLFIVGVYR